MADVRELASTVVVLGSRAQSICVHCINYSLFHCCLAKCSHDEPRLIFKTQDRVVGYHVETATCPAGLRSKLDQGTWILKVDLHR
jgi:hypothetical protein